MRVLMVGSRSQVGRWLGVVFLAACGWACAAETVVVTKGVPANPGIFLADFKGPEGVRAHLLSTLGRCDWFTVRPSIEGAAYLLEGTYAAGTPAGLELVAKFGEATVAQVRVSAGDNERLVFRAIDALISKLFDVPGLCASRLAFTVASAGRREVFLCNVDGSGATQLTRNGTFSTEPAWGPGARNLVHTVYGRDRTAVMEVDLNSRRQRLLSSFPGLNSGADVSPDGGRVAVCLSKDGRVDLYVMRSADKGLRRLTNDVAVESSPAWSPDGRSLCYVSDSAGKPQLYVVSAGGGRPSRLLNEVSECVSPDWSGVSNKICFATRQAGQYRIAVVDMADRGSGKTVVETEPGDWESPCWAPDGRHVVCTRSSGRQSQLVMVDTLSGRALPITASGDVSLPTWSDLH